MEYCAAGSALDLMNATGEAFLDSEIADVAAAMLYGLEYLHTQRRIHRDVKAGNLLLTSDGRAKLGQ